MILQEKSMPTQRYSNTFTAPMSPVLKPRRLVIIVAAGSLAAATRYHLLQHISL